MKLKLKYKKMIFGISLGTMAIGMAVLSINSSDKAKQTSGGVVQTASPAPGGEQVDGSEATPEAKVDSVTTSELLKNKHPEVNEVVKKYFKACLDADMDTLASVVSETETITKEQLQRWYEYVEDIKNIDCYTLPGPDEDSYFVFVYYEMKLVNIETLAPGLNQLYVTKTSDGNMIILISQIDDTIEESRDKALARKDIKELIQTVNKNLTEAVSKDAKLKEFVQKLNQSTQEAQKPTATKAPETKAPVATKAPTATKAPAAN